LVIQRFTPFSTQWSPSRTARVVIDTASLPASGSDRQYENMASPAATGGRYLRLTSSLAASSSGMVPSLLTAGIRLDEAQARATSSITIAVASASAPAPPYSAGMCGAWKSEERSASYEALGNSPLSSASAAFGATRASQTSRTAARMVRWSSGSW
jgi:hypothetical protein